MTYQRKIGLIGYGVMGESLARVWVEDGLFEPGHIVTCDPDPSRENLARQSGIDIAADARSLALLAPTVVVCVKPQCIASVLDDMGPVLSDDQLLISIAAGITTDFMEAKINPRVPVIRVMPNLPCTVGEGMMAFTAGRFVSARHLQRARMVLGGLGRLTQVEEGLMDAVTGLSGSGPAFLFMIMEAMADAGVQLGFTRQASLTMAAQSMLGSAKMVLDGRAHPAQLRDMVCSPGGTAIAGLHVLEKASVRAAMIDAVLKATERSMALGKKEPAQEERRTTASG